jgi:RNA polymerase sigma factor (sigma-70 family)
MATSPMSTVIQHLRQALARDEARETDGELLARFLNQGDDSALAALVRRHAGMVWGVCRRLLPNLQDAEDAFQATFLVLVRKVSVIRDREMVANWLYGVAHQTAVRMRATAAKRRVRERQVADMPEPAVKEDLGKDLLPLLDQELSRLPDKYRSLIVLCDLEGKTRKEVSGQLGCPEGTVASRLARARALLAERLARHGLAISAGGLAVVLSRGAAACVPPPVLSSTITAACSLAAGKAVTGLVAPRVAALTEGVLKGMLYSKLKAALALLASLAACACLVLAAGQQPGKVPEAPGEAPTRLERLEALWNDLASTDDARVTRALLAFTARPGESTRFLKDRLKPVKADPQQLKKLIAQLDDDDYPVREAASRTLAGEVEYLGKFARPILEQALKGSASPEAKRRLVELLKAIPPGPQEEAKQPTPPALPMGLQGRSVSVSNNNGQVQILVDGKPLDLAAAALPAAAPPRPNTLWLRALRAVALLESFGSPEARGVLETMAGAEPEAPPTQEAKAALRRLAKLREP